MRYVSTLWTQGLISLGAVALISLLALYEGRGGRLFWCQRSQKPIERLLRQPPVQNRQCPNSQPRLLKVIPNGAISTNRDELRPLLGKKLNDVALDLPAQLKNVANS